MFARDFDWSEEDASSKAEIGIKSSEDPFPWWIPVLISFEAIGAVVMGYTIFRLIKPKTKIVA